MGGSRRASDGRGGGGGVGVLPSPTRRSFYPQGRPQGRPRGGPQGGDEPESCDLESTELRPEETYRAFDVFSSPTTECSGFSRV